MTVSAAPTGRISCLNHRIHPGGVRQVRFRPDNLDARSAEQIERDYRGIDNGAVLRAQRR
jgi:hypothetical protein